MVTRMHGVPWIPRAHCWYPSKFSICRASRRMGKFGSKAYGPEYDVQLTMECMTIRTPFVPPRVTVWPFGLVVNEVPLRPVTE